MISEGGANVDPSLFSRPNWKRSGLVVLGLVLMVGLIGALVWYGLANRPASQPGDDVTPQAQVTASPTYILLPTATLTPTPQPAAAPPSPTPEPPIILPTAPPPTAYIVAGVDGVNVRSGPDISYEQLGYIDPDGQAEYLGVEGNWVQIRYQGEVAWVYGPLVTIVATPEAEAAPPTPTETPVATGETLTWPKELAQSINRQQVAQGLPGYTHPFVAVIGQSHL
jgi:hypothetical protein